MFKNKTILITGGTGSFGSSMVRYLLKTKAKQYLQLIGSIKLNYQLQNLASRAAK